MMNWRLNNADNSLMLSTRGTWRRVVNGTRPLTGNFRIECIPRNGVPNTTVDIPSNGSVSLIK